MSKETRNILITIVAVLFLFAVLFAVYDHFRSEPINANTSKENLIGDANTGLENMINDIFSEENIIEDEPNNTEPNKNTAENGMTKNEEVVEPTEDDSRMTPKEKKAIELVQEQWKKQMGSLDSVAFNVSIQNDGKYGVTVYDTTTTQTIQFYIVDVDTGIVKER